MESELQGGIEYVRSAIAQQGRSLKTVKKYGSWLLLAVILSSPFIFCPFIVTGGSMEPSLHEGQMVLVEKITPLVHVWRGEVLVILNPHDHKVTEIKRIIGLPDEYVEMNHEGVTVIDKEGRKIEFKAGTVIGGMENGTFKMQLGPKDYFVLGDNRSKSSDSRSFGAVQQVDIIGHVILKL